MNKNYYPKQLPYLLDKEFQENIEYKEYYMEELKDCAMCIWTMQSKRKLDKTIYNYILPDACIDIVIDFQCSTILFAGFSKETIPFQLSQTIDYMGVRLKPSVFYSIFHIDASSIMDAPINFFHIEKNSHLETIFQLKNIKERISFLMQYLCTKMEEGFHSEYVDIVNELYENPKEQTVELIAKRFGYDTRHLFRLFKKQYGISPKVLLNILRLHLSLTLLLEKNQSLQDILEICGFYDQSHFIKEIKKYTGFSPLELIEKY